MQHREQIREIKGHTPLQGYDLVRVMVMWWVSSHGRSAARRDTSSLGRTGANGNCSSCDKGAELHRVLSWDMRKLKVYESG